MTIAAVRAPSVDTNVETLPKDLEAACRSLEEAFATIVFRKMREAMVPKSDTGSAAFARETTQGLLDAQWARLSSQGEGLGLWRTLYRQLEPASVKSEAEGADGKSNGRPFSSAAERLGEGLPPSSPRSLEAASAHAATAAADSGGLALRRGGKSAPYAVSGVERKGR